MNRGLSIYLDLIRFMAANMVFVGHISGQRFTDGLFWQSLAFMEDAVTVFFVLSGFVIYFSTIRSRDTPTSFFISRASRIYSVALPAVIFTFLLDSAGRSLRPDLYSASWGYSDEHLAWQFLAGPFFMNVSWWLDLNLGSNRPWWSLCFEVWYYFLFGAMFFMNKKTTIAVFLFVLVLVGPEILISFPLWLVGVLAYKICSRERLSPLQGAALVLGMSAIYVIYKIWPHYSGLSLNIMPDIFGMPVWQTRYFVGVLFALHIVGFHAMAGWVTPLLMRFERPIRWCAGATFTIYLFHLPVAQFLSTLVPWPPGSWATRLVMLGGTLLILFGIAELTERRKDAWRRGIAALVGRFAVPGRQPG